MTIKNFIQLVEQADIPNMQIIGELGDGFANIRYNGMAGVLDQQTNKMILISPKVPDSFHIVTIAGGRETTQYVGGSELGPATKKALDSISPRQRPRPPAPLPSQESYESTEQVRSIVQRMMEDARVPQKPRQGPLRPQTGAGKHKDKKKDQKQGKEKHKNKNLDENNIPFAGLGKHKIGQAGQLRSPGPTGYPKGKLVGGAAESRFGRNRDDQFSLGGRMPRTDRIDRDSSSGQDREQAIVAKMKQQTINRLLDRHPEWERSDLELASLPELIQMLREAVKKPNATTRHLRDYPVSDKDVAKPVKPEKKKDEKKAVAEATYQSGTFSEYELAKNNPALYQQYLQRVNQIYQQELAKRKNLPSGQQVALTIAKQKAKIEFANKATQESVRAKQGVAEGLQQTLRKVVPGYAKREIDKKMDAGKFGKTDADKDANFQRYKKIQDKLKEQGVEEAANTGPYIVYATGPRTQGINDVDLVFKDIRTGKIVARVVGNNRHLQEFAPPSGGDGGDGGDLADRPPTYEIRMGDMKRITYVAFGDPQQDSEHTVYKLGPAKPGTPKYYGQGLTLVSELDWWSFLEKMIGEIMWEDDAIEAGYVDRLDNGDLVFAKQQDMAEGSSYQTDSMVSHISQIITDIYPQGGDKNTYMKLVARKMPRIVKADPKLFRRAFGMAYDRFFHMNQDDDDDFDYTDYSMRQGERGMAEEKQKGVDGKACWKGYKRMGTKKKGGKTVDNCVKMESISEGILTSFGLMEKSPPGFKGTVKAMKKHPELTKGKTKDGKEKNPWALAWHMKNKGYKSHKKADGSDKD